MSISRSRQYTSWIRPEFLALTLVLVVDKYTDLGKRTFLFDDTRPISTAAAPAPPASCADVDFSDDNSFRSGFSSAEDGWRWTDGVLSRVVCWLDKGDAPRYVLTLDGRAFETQELGLRINGELLARWTIRGWTARTQAVLIASEALREGENSIDLELPCAVPLPSDPRALGFAFIELSISAQRVDRVSGR